MLAQAARAAASAVNHQAAPARVLTAMEKAKLVCWFEETNSFAQTARRYRAEFGMEPPHFEQVKKWHQRFMSTGSLTNGHGGSGWLEAHSNSGGNDGQHGRMDATDTSFGLEAEEQLKMGGLH